MPPGTRIMSPNEVKMTPGVSATAIASSTRPIGITHTGQPGPMDELDGLRQDVLDAVPVDGVRVPAAHLHELERAVTGQFVMRATSARAAAGSRYSSTKRTRHTARRVVMSEPARASNSSS